MKKEEVIEGRRKKACDPDRNTDQKFVMAISIPIVLGILVGAYAYTDFAQNGITSPSIWAATLFVSFYSFVAFYFISITIYLWSD